VSGIVYPQFINQTQDFPGPRTDTMFFIVDGTQTITLTGRAIVVLSQAVPESSIKTPPVGIIKIQYGDRYWDDANLEWTLTDTTNFISLDDSDNKSDINPTGTVTRKDFSGKINIITSELPSNPSGNNTIVITLTKSPAPIEPSITTYNGMRFELSNSDEEKGSSAIVFNLDQAEQSSVVYNDGITYYGTGPSNYAMSAVRYSESSPEPSDTKLITSWNRRGTTPNRLMHENLTKEVMDSQRSYRRILQAILRKAYSPQNTLSYDSKAWFYIGGRFDGYSGDWEVTLAENAFVTATDDFGVLPITPGTNITSSLLTATTFATMDAIEATQGYLYRLSLSASGTISQLTVNGSDVTVKAGQILRIVHPITLQSEEVTVLSDKVGDTVFIETVTLANSYPAGAYVYVSAESQQAGIIVGENAVRIYAEGQSLGRLATAIDGLVTSINAHLYTKLVQGMEFIVINQQTGRTYAFTVDQATAGPGVVTFDVEAQLATARVGDYLVGDNSFQQSQITVTQGEIVLKVDSSGRVATVKLAADQDSGSEITISAEQVNINGIIFTEGTDPVYTPGDIATSNYSAGVAGWKIDGDGSAEFNNVVVRGSLEASTIDGNLTMDGGSITNTGGEFTLDDDGLTLELATAGSVPQGAEVKWGTIKIYGQISGFSNELVLQAPTGLGASFILLDADNVNVNNGDFSVSGLSSIPSVVITELNDTDTPYTIVSSISYYSVDNNASAFSITLPTGTSGREITIFDVSGGAGVGSEITINRASTDTINGATSYAINSAYGSATLIFNRGNWTII
jgi:hypothetical protein